MRSRPLFLKARWFATESGLTCTFPKALDALIPLAFLAGCALPNAVYSELIPYGRGAVAEAGRQLMGILKTAVYGLSAVSLAAILCHAQVYNFNSVTAGLGNLDVNCIAQDHAGYIWVGTENGLYRYDGRSFSAFGPADGLSSHVIQSLFAAPDGTLFVGTTTGIYFQRHDGAIQPDSPPSARDGIFAKNRNRVHCDCTGPGGHRGPQRRVSVAAHGRGHLDRRAHVSGRTDDLECAGGAERRALVRMRLRPLPS